MTLSLKVIHIPSDIVIRPLPRRGALDSRQNLDSATEYLAAAASCWLSLRYPQTTASLIIDLSGRSGVNICYALCAQHAHSTSIVRHIPKYPTARPVESLADLPLSVSKERECSATTLSLDNFQTEALHLVAKVLRQQQWSIADPRTCFILGENCRAGRNARRRIYHQVRFNLLSIPLHHRRVRAAASGHSKGRHCLSKPE